MIKKIRFHRFKQFGDRSFDLRPSEFILLAGGNNSGKSSILHGLAVWQFCKTAMEMERGSEQFGASAAKQGLGLGDEEFSPINVPSLSHLWTNLRSGKNEEPDGYTLKICCYWDELGNERYLEFGMALANDRLFIKQTDSNIDAPDSLPRIAYLPPFAGITDREMRLPGAIRRRRVGEGLAGAILRNLLLDMYERNVAQRARLRGDRSKIPDTALKNLRETDPWELLQATLRETFAAELKVSPFKEEYHSYIRVEVEKGEVSKNKLKRYPKYRRRDIMVEGSGFLQWLSVFALALDPNIDTLLLDEPDAHLHCTLQEHLTSKLRDLARKAEKQILFATHSTEILRSSPIEEVLHLQGGRGRYLRDEEQRAGLLTGLGSDYAPRVDRLKKTKRLFFVEGISDLKILKIFCGKLGLEWPIPWVEWRTSAPHKERRLVFNALASEIDGLLAFSLRDRDDEPLGSVGERLIDGAHTANTEGFHRRKWRRRNIESYLLWPPAIAEVCGVGQTLVEEKLRDSFAIAVPPLYFTQTSAPEALLNIDGKKVLLKDDNAMLRGSGADIYDLARAMEADSIPDDIKIILEDLIDIAD